MPLNVCASNKMRLCSYRIAIKLTNNLSNKNVKLIEKIARWLVSRLAGQKAAAPATTAINMNFDDDNNANENENDNDIGDNDQ